MNSMSDIADEVKYVSSSKYRTNVMKALKEGGKMPKELSEDTCILQNHMSNVLRQLKEHGLVVCINPEVCKGRVYRLTDKGEEVVENIN